MGNPGKPWQKWKNSAFLTIKLIVTEKILSNKLNWKKPTQSLPRILYSRISLKFSIFPFFHWLSPIFPFFQGLFLQQISPTPQKHQQGGGASIKYLPLWYGTFMQLLHRNGLQQTYLKQNLEQKNQHRFQLINTHQHFTTEIDKKYWHRIKRA